MYNYKSLFLVLISTLAVVLAIPAVNYVSAQDYPTSMPSIPAMQQVSGKYTNADTGLQIVLPTDWSGYEIHGVNGTLVTSMPSSGSSAMQKTSMVVAMFDKRLVQSPPSTPPPANPNQKVDCKQDSTTPVTINGMSGIQIIMSCTGDVSTKTKMISFQTDKYYINTIFIDTPASFDSNVAAFDNSVNTLQIPNTTSAPSIPGSSTTQSTPSTPQSSEPTATTQNTTSNAAVPEFPIATVAAIAALMMAIAIFATKRQQLFRVQG